MKKWTIKYRCSDGSVSELTVDAEDRTEVISKMRQRGITPMSISEEVKVARKIRIASIHFNWASITPLLFVLVVLVGLIAWVISASTPQRLDKYNLATPSKVSQPTIASELMEPLQTNDQVRVDIPVKMPSPKSSPHKIGLDRVISVMTNTNGTVTERIQRADGKIVRTVKPAPRIFESGSDEILAMIASMPSGQEMPPLPPGAITEQQFLDSLKTPILISDGDSDRVRLLKQSVIVLRQQVKELMDAGQPIGDILAEHQKLQRENAEVRTQALIEMKNILDSGKRSDAIHYVQTVNQVLEQMGIEGIPVPSNEPAKVDPRILRNRNEDN